jgi:hypothetical protein
MPDRLDRRLGVTDAVVIGLGSMLGAGVFSAVGPAAGAAGSWLLAGLVVAGLVAYANATSSAALAALYPESGGDLRVRSSPAGTVLGVPGRVGVPGRAAGQLRCHGADPGQLPRPRAGPAGGPGRVGRRHRGQLPRGGQDGGRDLPHALAAVHPRHRVPHRAELAVAVLVAAAVLAVDLRGAIGFSSARPWCWSTTPWPTPPPGRSARPSAAVLGLGTAVWVVRSARAQPS